MGGRRQFLEIIIGLGIYVWHIITSVTLRTQDPGWAWALLNSGREQDFDLFDHIIPGGAGGHVGFEGSTSGQLCGRQAPYILYSHSCPKNRTFNSDLLGSEDSAF